MFAAEAGVTRNGALKAELNQLKDANKQLAENVQELERANAVRLGQASEFLDAASHGTMVESSGSSRTPFSAEGTCPSSSQAAGSQMLSTYYQHVWLDPALSSETQADSSSWSEDGSSRAVAQRQPGGSPFARFHSHTVSDVRIEVSFDDLEARKTWFDKTLPITDFLKSQDSDDLCRDVDSREPLVSSAFRHKRKVLRSEVIRQHEKEFSQYYLTRKAILAMFQSTAPTSEVSRLLLAFQGAGLEENLSSLYQGSLHQDRIMTSESATFLRARNKLENPPKTQLRRQRSSPCQYQADGSYEGPLHFVLVSRWTRLVATPDDESGSHLISLFLKCLNPYWRLVEEDTFLQTSRRSEPSQHCSSFLVNAILACAAVRLAGELSFILVLMCS